MVYCGVCASVISEQIDNEGSIPVTSDFTGWDFGPECPRRTSRDDFCVKDTCRACNDALRTIVTGAANKIVDAHRNRVEALRAEVAAQRRRYEEHEKAKQKAVYDFERDWAARQAAAK